jgi:putative membrane protein
MEMFATILVLFVALFHVQAFIMEAFLWKTPRALKAFAMTAKEAEITHPLAINQGVYNLFLSAGLVLSFLLEDPFHIQAQIFFLVCVIVAAITAGITGRIKITLLQGLPALLALLAIYLTA